MRALLLAALLMIGVPQAWGATYHVRQAALGNGSGSNNANSMAIATFNALGSGGNVALLHGNFTTVPNPTAVGTMAAPIIYRNGATNNSLDSVSFGTPGNNLNFDIAGTGTARHVLYRDFTVRGRVYLGTSQAAVTMSRIRMSRIRIIDGYLRTYRLDDCKFDSLALTIPASTAYPSGVTIDFGRADKGVDSVWYSSRDTLSNSTFNNAGAATQVVEGGLAAAYVFAGRNMVYESLRCSLTTTNSYIAGTPLRFSRVCQTQGGRMTNCFFYGYWTQGGAGVDEPMNWVFKDGVRFFTMDRCTVLVVGDGHIADTNHEGYPYINFAQDEGDGTAAQACESIGGNTITRCFFSNQTQSTHPIYWYTNATDGDSIAYNTFISGRSGGAYIDSYSRGNGNAVDRVSTGNTVFDHNTFVTYCPRAYALALNGTKAAEQAIKFTNNIFAAPYLSNADTSSFRAVHFGHAATWGSAAVGPVGNNYNLTATPNATTQRQVKWRGTCGSTCDSTWKMGLDKGWTTTRSPLTNDFNSRHTAQSFAITFTDTALATFNPLPTSRSAALFGPQGFVGAVPAVSTHIITATSGPEGYITPAGLVYVDDGTDQQFNIIALPGYHVSAVMVDGSSVGAVAAYTFTNVTADHSIAAQFVVNDYTITASTSGGGTIVPSGSVPTAADDEPEYVVSPLPGHYNTNIKVDDAWIGPNTSYIFGPVMADHTIHATFGPYVHTVTATNGTGGTIAPQGSILVVDGTDQGFAFFPSTGYHVSDIRVDGSSAGAPASYTFTNVTADHAILSQFSINTYTIASSASGGGSVWPTGTNAYNYGASQTYHFQPTSGSYQLLGVDVDGVTVGHDSTYTFTGIAANHTVLATFGAVSNYTISASAGAHGVISPAGGATVASGASATFTIWPDITYRVLDVLVDGASQGAIYSYTFSNVTANHTIAATFTAATMPNEARASFVRPAFPLVLKNAGSGGQGGGANPQTYPMVTGAGATNATTIGILAEQPMAILQIAAADSLLPTAGENSQTVYLKAMRDLRAANPSISLIGMHNMDAGWIGGITTRDTTAKYHMLADMWWAGRKVGWTPGNPMTQTTFPNSGQDTLTGSKGFLWNKTSGWKGAYFQARSYGAGAPGSSNCDLNIAYRGVGGTWPVRDSIVSAYFKQMERVDPITGRYVWDGFYLDLALAYAYPMSGDTADWVRAGYTGTTSAAFDTAWFDASSYIFRRLREHADSLGRSNFIIKSNAGLGYAYEYLHGWTVEDWPNNDTVSSIDSEKWRDNWTKPTQHNSRSGGFELATGIQGHGFKYRQDYPASMIALSPGAATSDSVNASTPGVANDTLLAYRKAITYGLATASLANQWVHVPSSKAPRFNWWFDEYGVDRRTGTATRGAAYTGWLGYPSDHWYNNNTTIGTRDTLGTSGRFDTGAQQAEWTLGSNAYGAATFDADTSVSGSSLRLQTLSCYPTHVDYSYTAASKVKWKTAIGDTITVSFWARANYERPLRVALKGRDGSDRATWGHVWLGTTWNPYRVSAAMTDTQTVNLEFWAGDTTGIVWVDSARCQIGRFRGGSYLRQFEHGFVIVNPTPHADTIAAPIKCRRITSRVAPNYNNGVQYAAGAAIPVPSCEALFLVEDNSAAASIRSTSNPFAPRSRSRNR